MRDRMLLQMIRVVIVEIAYVVEIVRRFFHDIVSIGGDWEGWDGHVMVHDPAARGRYKLRIAENV